MAALLEVAHLYKQHPGFQLRDVSFDVGAGRVVGFLGRGGAGKTSAIKCILNLARPDSGTIRCFGLDPAESKAELGQRIGYAGGAVDYYPRKPAREIAAAMKKFYNRWDDAEYHSYLRIFNVNEDWTPARMPEDMRRRLALVLALSRHAELLVFDEPMVGLDPLSRAALKDIFRQLKKLGVSTLFSTCSLADLERCVDDIVYIRNGEIIAAEPLVDFVAYRRVRGFGESLEKIMAHYEKEAWRELVE